jgi:hypothetical protein
VPRDEFDVAVAAVAVAYPGGLTNDDAVSVLHAPRTNPWTRSTPNY